MLHKLKYHRSSLDTTFFQWFIWIPIIHGFVDSNYDSNYELRICEYKSTIILAITNNIKYVSTCNSL